MAQGQEKPSKNLVIFLVVVLALLLAAYFAIISRNDHSQTQAKPNTAPIETPRASQGNQPSVPPGPRNGQ